MADTRGTPEDLGARVAELDARLREVEGRERRTRKVRSLFRELMPPEVREHLRAAQREQLLAARSFIDHWIARTEREAGSERRETITVE